MIAIYISCLLICTTVYGDIYMHNPRGSNNRLNGNQRERNNANRLFDSQNNNRGGYNANVKGNIEGVPMYYHSGSILNVQWTNQHQCNGENTFCDIILQYMCSETLRDGITESTIPDNRNGAKNEVFGMHEDYEHYLNCKVRSRNTGLFLADQDLKGTSAIYTRQNPAGTRRGLECPEERDYYPYWGPTPWKDVAVMTNDASRCKYYQKESQNVKEKYYCDPPQAYKDAMENNRNNPNFPRIPITKARCENMKYPKEDSPGRGVWTKAEAWDINPPDCLEAPKSRDNHLGNGKSGSPNSYNWKIPLDPNQRCVLRIRYNISTDDYSPNLDYMGNGDIAKDVDMQKLVGLSNAEAKERGYVFQNDPTVYPFGKDKLGEKLGLALALNTAQFGRTFEDRSHQFAIVEAPPNLEGKGNIYNVNVQGKRGNIVQTYPAVEYDFVPNTLEVEEGDYIHFQWTGSDQNPNNNDGEGPNGQDRSNLAVLKAPKNLSPNEDYTAKGLLSASYPEHLDNSSFLGFSRDDLDRLAFARNKFERRKANQDGDRSRTPYFDLGYRAVSQPGTYHYLCTINNNFSNRSQKGTIIVKKKGSAKKDQSNSKTTGTNKEKGKKDETDNTNKIGDVSTEYEELNKLTG